MEFITMNDSIDVLNLSVRSSNALKRASILTVGAMLAFPIEEFRNVKNVGAKSVSEVSSIIESLKNATNKDFCLMDPTASNSNSLDIVPTERDNQISEEIQKAFGKTTTYWLREILQAKQEHDSENDAVYLFWVYKSPVIRNAVMAEILKKIDSISECCISDITLSMPKHLQNTTIVEEILTEMVAENLITISGDYIEHSYPSIVDYACSIEDERVHDILLARLHGLTLEEIGQRYDLTRERVRQVISKYRRINNHLAEDKYKYLFENYYFSREDFQLAFGEREVVYNYLTMITDSTITQRKPIADILEDEVIPVSLRKRAEKAVYKDYITINGVRVHKRRRDLAEYVIRTKCKELTKFEDFRELYKKQLQELGLGDDPAFEIDEGTYTNKLQVADYVLWSQGQQFRYYYIPERDYEPLLSALDLKQYQNTEFSSLKLFRDYPDLMREYDIRDEYELHNLLRKIWPKEHSEVVFKKMPTITVGNPDRDTQVLDLLLQFAPISANDLAKEYEATYGAKSATVIGTYLKNFSEYYHDGLYSIEADNLPYDQFNRMKEVLREDFYMLPQIKKLYKEAFPVADESNINPYTIKTLGFKVYSGYAVRDIYSSAFDYFSKILTASDDYSLDDLPAGISQLPTFMQMVYDLKESRQIVEYKPRYFVSKAKLESLGVTKDKINEYCSSVQSFAQGKKYYTIGSLREDGFTHKIGAEEYDDWFYASLLIEDRDRFSYKRIGRTKVLMNGNTDVSFAEMLVWIVQQRQRMTYSALNKHLEKYYGIFLSKDKLLGIIHEAMLYFDPIMEEIYINYDAYKM